MNALSMFIYDNTGGFITLCMVCVLTEYSWIALSAEGQCSCDRSVPTGGSIWGTRLTT